MLREGHFTVPIESSLNSVDRPEIVAWIQEKKSAQKSPIALVGFDGLGLVSILLINLPDPDMLTGKKENLALPFSLQNTLVLHRRRLIFSGFTQAVRRC